MKTSLGKIDPAKFFNVADPRPYINMSFRGDQGSGKSMTAATVAGGIFKHLYHGKGGIVLVDTENSSKYLRPILEAAGFRWTRPDDPENNVFLLGPHPDTGALPTLADVCAAMEWMHEERVANIMLIDSLTTIHREFYAKYSEEHLRGKELQLKDYRRFNARWREEFSQRATLLRGCHFWTGRLGNVFESVADSKGDDATFVKTKNKMAGDRETEYEADITIEMRSHEETGRVNKKGAAMPARVWRSAVILKSRFPRFDGLQFNLGGSKKGPGYDDFRAVIEECIGVLPKAGDEAPQQRFESTRLVQGHGRSYDEQKESEALRARISAMITALGKKTGETAENILFTTFGVRSAGELAEESNHDLEMGFKALKAKLQARGNGDAGGRPEAAGVDAAFFG